MKVLGWGAFCGLGVFLLACTSAQTSSVKAERNPDSDTDQSVSAVSSEPAPSATIATHDHAAAPHRDRDALSEFVEATNSLDFARPGPVSVSGASVSGGSVSNAAAVVAGMVAGFRRCYNKGLAEDPSMRGSVIIRAEIGPNGEVVSAKPANHVGLSGTVVACVASRVASAQFAPPDGGTAKVAIPISFEPP